MVNYFGLMGIWRVEMLPPGAFELPVVEAVATVIIQTTVSNISFVQHVKVMCVYECTYIYKCVPT